MATQTREILKTYFQTGKYPTEAQFAALIDSMRHKDDQIGIAYVTGLADALNALNQALAGKQNTLTFDNTPTDGSGNPVTSAGIKSAIDSLSAELLNYYLKSETYSKSEVNALFAAIRQFSYEVAATLPTASADTMYRIYLVPSPNDQEQNVKDEYITIATTENDVTTYDWEQIGSTAVDFTTQTDITYADLVTLQGNSQLIPGMRYRITDYVTKVTGQENGPAGVSSAEHPFDIIVVATSSSTLSENALAAIHSGDLYFADCNLEAWQLKYCLDNDTTRFDWADATNGKGVIYRMIDEHGNDCPYDFKNILYNTGTAASPAYKYTFDKNGNDDSIGSSTCFSNIVGAQYLTASGGIYRMYLPFIRFGSGCNNCRIGSALYTVVTAVPLWQLQGCHNITIAGSSHNVVIEGQCSGIAINVRVQNLYIEANNHNLTINYSSSLSYDQFIRNIHINPGVGYLFESKTVTLTEKNQKYKTTIVRTDDKTMTV